MEERQGYDVLRIVVHGDRCYMSTDYVKGKQLIVWLKYHSRIDKQLLYGWIRELTESLEHFHQCRGNPCYQYVNPYSIIVGENKKLYLLDLGSRDQDELLHLMQRRYVRENFLSPDNQYYQKTGIQEDIYGFGRTVQYLLSATEVEPALRKTEEFRLKNMISRCVNRNSKKCYQTIQEISEYYPNNRKRNDHKITAMRKALACAAVLIGFAVAVTQTAGEKAWNRDERKGEKPSSDLSDTENDYSKILEDYREEMQQKQEQWTHTKQEIEKTYAGRERKLVYDLALLYFIELEDYNKSRETMERIAEQEAFDKDFAELCAFMDNQAPTVTEGDMEELLERLNREIPDPEDERYVYCVSKGYEKIKEKVQEKEGEMQAAELQDAELQNTGEQEADSLLNAAEGSQEVTEVQ